MDIRLIVSDAVKAKKSRVTFPSSNLSDIMIDTYIRMGIKQSGIEATYTFVNNKTTKQVDVTFGYPKKETAPATPKKETIPVAPKKEVAKPAEPAKKESPKKEEKKSPSLLSRIKNKVSDLMGGGSTSATPKRSGPYNNGPLIYVTDRGGVDTYISYFDLSKTNNFLIKSSNPSRTFVDIKANSDYITAELEGVIACRFGTTDEGVNIIFELGMDYDEFKSHLLIGHQKAKETYQTITNGVSLPDEYKILLVYLYLEKNVKYNRGYMKKMTSDTSFDMQEIDNAMAYGALNNHSAICEGYSWAMIKILENAGVRARPAYGDYNGNSHQWVKVMLNGEWYNADPTFSYLSTHYGVRNFLISDATAVTKGYKDECPVRATSKKYEGSALQSFINKFQKEVDNYVRKGLPRMWKNIIIDILE